MSAAPERPVVLVTGAAGHMGAAITHSLAARGAALALVDRAGDALMQLGATLPMGTPVLSITADVTATGAAEDTIARCVGRFGRLDALVNNAGMEGPVGRAEDLDDGAVRTLFDVNVFALLRFSSAAIRHFRGIGGGRIVNMASGAGLRGTALMSAYSASKHAVVGLTRSMAKEAAADGVVINAVCPGCIESPMMERIEARLGEIAGTAPVSFLPAIASGRYGDAAEVAELVAWLALEAPAYITGAALPIDGGLGA